MSDYIKDVFGAGGVLARSLPRYEPRAGQIELSEAVDEALRDGKHLLAEAPTGTGKSMAYAVPAAWHTTRGMRTRVVIATANIALQEQLVGKDLPFLKRVLPFPFEFALAKGRSNYVCLDRLDHADEALGKMAPDDASAFDRLLGWARTTATGDVSELPEVPVYRLWGELSVGSDQCKGSRCPRRDECFVQRAKAAAALANVVVANYHLLFADVSVRGETDDSVGVLPVYDAAVLDEGHRAADIARDFFGLKTSEAACRRLVNDAMRTMRDAQVDGVPGDVERALVAVEDEAGIFFARMLAYKRSKDYRVRLRRPGEINASTLAGSLQRLGKQFIAFGDDASFDGGDRAAFRNIARRANEHAACLSRASDMANPDGEVYFIEESPGGRGGPRAAVCIKPIDVADDLRAGLFGKAASVTAMSATMTTVAGDFEHVAIDLGVDESAEVVVPSPFDMARQALFIVPATMPDPNDSAFREEMANAVLRTVELAEGRTLGLFTSYRNLNLAAERLRSNGIASKYRVLVQGEGSRTALVEEFRRDVSSVLLGTESFWEGIDVPGEALSCLIIDRLPFATPEDPVLDAVAERDPKGWFQKWSLPRALIAFRQGFGRLIRSTTDRGVVVCLDRRVHEKAYGRQFIKSLGGVRCTRNLDDVRVFLRG